MLSVIFDLLFQMKAEGSHAGWKGKSTAAIFDAFTHARRVHLTPDLKTKVLRIMTLMVISRPYIVFYYYYYGNYSIYVNMHIKKQTKKKKKTNKQTKKLSFCHL